MSYHGHFALGPTRFSNVFDSGPLLSSTSGLDVKGGRAKGPLTSLSLQGLGSGASYAEPPSPENPTLETAGKQDEVLRLRAALNEKEMELIEMREQHMQLMARTQEASTNWEGALAAKDNAISQLEEALISRQKMLDQMAGSGEAEAQRSMQELKQERNKVAHLEARLSEALDQVSTLEANNKALKQQLEAVSSQLHDARTSQNANREVEDQLQQRLRQVTKDFELSQDEATGLRRDLMASRQEKQQAELVVWERDQQIRRLQQQQQTTEEEVHALRENLKKYQSMMMTRNKERRRDSSEDEVDVDRSRKGQQQELKSQLMVLQQKMQAKDNSARKYKEAVKALKVKLAEKINLITLRDHKFQDLLHEVSELQAKLRHAPQSPSQTRNAGMGLEMGVSLAEVERMRVELHGAHMELTSLQMELMEKEKMLQKVFKEAGAGDQQKKEANNQLVVLNRKLYDMERMVKEAEEQLHISQLRSQDLHERCQELEMKLKNSQDEVTNVNRKNDDLDRKMRDMESVTRDAVRQAKVAEQRQVDAEKRADDSARRGNQLERKLHDLEVKLEEAGEEGEKLLQRAERAERQVRDSEAHIEEAERRVKQLETKVSTSDWKAKEAESRMNECNRRVKDADLRVIEIEGRGKEMETKLKLAEARALEAERRCIDLEGRVQALEKKLREAEAQALELSSKAKEVERERDDLQQAVQKSDTAMKQLRADHASELMRQEMNSGSRYQAELQELQEVTLSLQKMKMAKIQAEKRVQELEVALGQQERVNQVLRQQQADCDATIHALSVLEMRVHSLEDMLAVKKRSISNLKDSLAQSEMENRKATQELFAELQDRSAKLADAETRFQDLEYLVHNIVAQSG